MGKTLKFLGLRYDQQLKLDNSLLWQVQQVEACDLKQLQFVGWEPNRNKQMRPRFVSMRDSMDPAKYGGYKNSFSVHSFFFSCYFFSFSSYACSYSSFSSSPSIYNFN